MANDATHKANVAATASGMAAIGVTVTSISLLLGGVAVGLSCERWATGPRQCDDVWKSGLGGVAGGGLGLVGTWLKNPYLRRREDDQAADEPAAPPIDLTPDPRGGGRMSEPPPLIDPWRIDPSLEPWVDRRLTPDDEPQPQVEQRSLEEEVWLDVPEAPPEDARARYERLLREELLEQMAALALQLDEKIAQQVQELEQRLGDRILERVSEALKAPVRHSLRTAVVGAASASGKGFAADAQPGGQGKVT